MRFYSTRRLGSGELIVTTEAAGFVDPYAGEQRPEDAELSREELLDLPGGRQALWKPATIERWPSVSGGPRMAGGNDPRK